MKVIKIKVKLEMIIFAILGIILISISFFLGTLRENSKYVIKEPCVDSLNGVNLNGIMCEHEYYKHEEFIPMSLFLMFIGMMLLLMSFSIII